MLVGSNDDIDNLILINLVNFSVIKSYRGHWGIVYRVEIFNDYNRMISAGLDNYIIIWDYTTG